MVGTPRIELDSMAFQTTAMTTLARCPTNLVDVRGVEPPSAGCKPAALPVELHTHYVKLGGTMENRTPVS